MRRRGELLVVGDKEKMKVDEEVTTAKDEKKKKKNNNALNIELSSISSSISSNSGDTFLGDFEESIGWDSNS